MAAWIGYSGGMENRTQPILCCVGADVAGEPTQFLMERAALAGHLDWHVITVEVASEQLATAWNGMKVMRFQAVRFFPTHQAGAMHMVAEPTPDDLFIGGITSAMRIGDQWTMWHNSGPALVELLATRVKWDAAACWVHGDSAATRSFLVACHANPPRKIYWTGSNLTSMSANSDAASAPGNSLPESLSSLPLEMVPAERESEMANVVMARAVDEDAISAVVHVGEMDVRHLDQLLANQPDFECSLAIVSSAPGSRRKLNLAWQAGEVIVIAPSDLVIAEEAYDQARWTGQPVNVELLREAYEEYVDF